MSSSPGSEPAAGIADLLLWPWRVGRALALLPISFQLQEGPSGTAASQSSTPQAPRPLHDKLRAALQPKEYVLVVPRALHSWQAGQQVFSHALAYNAVEAGVKLLHLQPAAERLLGASHALLRGAVGTPTAGKAATQRLDGHKAGCSVGHCFMPHCYQAKMLVLPGRIQTSLACTFLLPCLCTM